MKRRHFIGMAAAGAAGFMLPATGRDDEAFALATLAHPHLLDILRDEDVVHDLGERYRTIVPAENNARLLAEAIAGEPKAMARADLRARVNGQIERDFASGRTVILDGWVLSLTEVRQCALYSLFWA